MTDIQKIFLATRARVRNDPSSRTLRDEGNCTLLSNCGLTHCTCSFPVQVPYCALLANCGVAKLGELLAKNKPAFSQGKDGKIKGEKTLPDGINWKISHEAQTLAKNPEKIVFRMILNNIPKNSLFSIQVCVNMCVWHKIKACNMLIYKPINISGCGD